MKLHKKVLILIGSPRRNGNTSKLAYAVQEGAQQSNINTEVCFIDDYISSFLRDCRTCRLSNGECSIEDHFKTLFFDIFLPSDALVICSPIYWYGLSAQMKSFFDRTFCYYAESYPDSSNVVNRMVQKRIGLLLSSEETFPGAEYGILHQIQEFSRYTESDFIGVVRGIGNKRGEVSKDPSMPIQSAKTLGENLFKQKYTDFRLKTQRTNNVWKINDQ